MCVHERRRAQVRNKTRWRVLLRNAYEATESGFDGHVSVPTLWDRRTGRVFSNDFTLIGIDLATRFGEWGNGAGTHPERLRPQIEELDGWIGPAVNRGWRRRPAVTRSRCVERTRQRTSCPSASSSGTSRPPT